MPRSAPSAQGLAARQCAAALAAAVLLAGCNPAPAPREKPADARHETLAAGDVSLRVRLTPHPPALDRTLFLDFTLETPTGYETRFPALDDRLEGFRVTGFYENPPEPENGRLVRTIRASVVPIPAARHRLKPMAVEWTHPDDAARSGWLQTRPLDFALAPLPAPDATPRHAAPSVRIPRSWRDARLPAALALVGLLGLAALLALVRAVRRAVRIRRLNPHDRALHEMDRLLARRLWENGQVKEFYFELTLIVRRFIERAFGIRAPEQTTEEFLQAAGADPRFPAASLRTLAAFLEAADLVKYAGFRPDPDRIHAAVAAARDAVALPPRPPPGQEAR